MKNCPPSDKYWLHDRQKAVNVSYSELARKSSCPSIRGHHVADESCRPESKADVSDNESLAAPSPLPSEERNYFCAGSHGPYYPAYFKRSQESVISLMSSTTTSGLGHSQSPLMIGRNFHRSSNRRFSSRHLVLAPNSNSAASSRSSVAESRMSSSPRSQEICRRWKMDDVPGGGCSKRSSLATSTSKISCTAIRKPLPPLPVHALPFDVPTVSEYEPFVGRDWLYHELFEILVRPDAQNGMKGAIIYGDSGSGKTTVCYNLVRLKTSDHVNFYGTPCSSIHSGGAWRYKTSSSLLAYHFCSIDDHVTCDLAHFLLSLIGQCSRHPIFYEYHEKLLKNVGVLNVKSFLVDPVLHFRHLFTDPLTELYNAGKLPLSSSGNLLIVVDGLDESEYHKPEFGDSIGSFLLKYGEKLFPDFVKLVLTIKSSHLDFLKGLRLHKINLDDTVMDERVYTDAVEYINMRINDKSALRKNVSVAMPTNSKKVFNNNPTNQNRAADDGTANVDYCVNRFVEHFVAISKGNFLYMKLTLNLIERNFLVMKGANYKILPVDLAETFLLTMNLRFPTGRSYDKVGSVFNVLLASLRPPSGRQLYEIVNSQFVDDCLGQEEFSERLELVQDYLVQKKDETFTFFHSAFRDWLVRRDENKSPKYLCDSRQGHALIAVGLCRKQDHLLDAEQLQSLSHHLLKAHLYKKVSAANSSSPRDSLLYWLNLRAADIKRSLCTERNAYSPNTKVSRLLLLAGADPDAQLEDGSTLLCATVKHSRNEFAALLVEFGADVNLRDVAGLSPLIHASSAGNLDAVQFLHQHGAELSQTDVENRCALVHAAISGRVDILSFFLQCDWSALTNQNQASGTATVACVDSAQRSANKKQRAVQQAFVTAAECGQLQACQFLYEFGDSEIDEQCPVTSETALSISCLKCRNEIASYLIKSGAKLNYDTNMQRLSPLLRAVEGGCWEIVSTLLARGIDVNAERNEKMETSLIKVAQTGHIGIMELLLSREAQLNSVDSEGRTAFCWACIENRVACASLLLDRGCKMNTIDKYGKSPVHYVAKSGSKQLVTLLLDSYPNVGQLLETCDSSGRRPLEIAIESGNLDAVQKFLRKGAKLVPETWYEAKTKPVVLVILLRKLFDDGKILYKKNQIRDAEHRFRYALKKFDTHFPILDSDTIVLHSAHRTNNIHNIDDQNNIRKLKYQLYLNLARCRRKGGDREGALRSCTDAVEYEPEQAEAYYCRGRCYYEAEMYDLARDDLFMVLKIEKASDKASSRRQHNPDDRISYNSNSNFSISNGRSNDSNNTNISIGNNNLSTSPPMSAVQFSKEATDLLLKINDILKRNRTTKSIATNNGISGDSSQGHVTGNNSANMKTIVEMADDDKRLKNWEQGSSDSGNMPDIEALKV